MFIYSNNEESMVSFMVDRVVSRVAADITLNAHYLQEEVRAKLPKYQYAALSIRENVSRLSESIQARLAALQKK